MQGSIDRIRAVIDGQQPDRAPMFDLLRNTAATEHFTGEKLTVENGPELVYKTYAPATDAAEGRITIGSSTELNEEVPLANFLALRAAVLDQ